MCKGVTITIAISLKHLERYKMIYNLSNLSNKTHLQELNIAICMLSYSTALLHVIG